MEGPWRRVLVDLYSEVARVEHPPRHHNSRYLSALAVLAPRHEPATSPLCHLFVAGNRLQECLARGSTHCHELWTMGLLVREGTRLGLWLRSTYALHLRQYALSRDVKKISKVCTDQIQTCCVVSG